MLNGNQLGLQGLCGPKPEFCKHGGMTPVISKWRGAVQGNTRAQPAHAGKGKVNHRSRVRKAQRLPGTVAQALKGPFKPGKRLLRGQRRLRLGKVHHEPHPAHAQRLSQAVDQFAQRL